LSAAACDDLPSFGKIAPRRAAVHAAKGTPVGGPLPRSIFLGEHDGENARRHGRVGRVFRAVGERVYKGEESHRMIWTPTPTMVMKTNAPRNKTKNRKTGAAGAKAVRLARSRPEKLSHAEQDRLVLAKVAYGLILTAPEKRRLKQIQAGFGLDSSVVMWEKHENVPMQGFSMKGATVSHHLTKRGQVITEIDFPAGKEEVLLPPTESGGDATDDSWGRIAKPARGRPMLPLEALGAEKTQKATPDNPQVKWFRTPLGFGFITRETPESIEIIPFESIGNIPLAAPTTEGARVEAPGIVEIGQFIPFGNTAPGAKGEGLLNKALATLLTSWGVPETDFEATAAELERVARARANVARRPKWDERGKYTELKDLSSPAFLKRVYADEIGEDGSIQKEAVRKIDPKLMAAVETYVSAREGRRRDMGDAAGLHLIAGPHTRPKRANLG